MLGAGGGGYFLFVAKDGNRFSLKKALEEFGLRVTNIEFEEQGLQAWKMYSYSADSHINNIDGGIK